MRKQIRAAAILLTLAFTMLCGGCTGITEIREGESGDFSYVVYVGDTVGITGYNGDATEVTVPSEIEGLPVTTIDVWAFSDNATVKKVILPDGITNIRGSAFENCTALESISIPDSVAYLGSSAPLATGSTSSVDYGSVFKGCTSLKSVKLPDGLREIERHMFAGCTSLTEIDIPYSVEEIKWGAFKDCTALETITIHRELTDIIIADSAFDGTTIVQKNEWSTTYNGFVVQIEDANATDTEDTAVSTTVADED